MMQWKYISHCQTGLSHLEDNKGCQDDVLIRENGECLAAALADGLGYYTHSEVAAKAATEAAVSWLLNRGSWLFAGDDVETLLVEQMLGHVKDEVLRAAHKNQIDESNLDCNLTFVCIMKSTGKAIIGQLGDCALCLIGKESRVLTDLSGAYGTSSVLDPHASDRLVVKLVDLDKLETDTVILTSDGMEKEIYRKGSNIIRKSAQFYANLLIEAGRGEDLLKQRLGTLVRNYANVFDDDISIVILSRATRRIELPEDPTWLCFCGQRNNIINNLCQRCGQEFINIYPRLDISGHLCLDAFFRHLNRNPDQERQVLKDQGKSPSSAQPADSPTSTVSETSPFRELMKDDTPENLKVSQGSSVTPEMLAKQWGEKSSEPKVQERISAPKAVRSTELTPDAPVAPQRKQARPTSGTVSKPQSPAKSKGSTGGQSADEIRGKGALFTVPTPLQETSYDPPEEPNAVTEPKGKKSNGNKLQTAGEQPDDMVPKSNCHPSHPVFNAPDEDDVSPPPRKSRLLPVVLGIAVLLLLILLGFVGLRGGDAAVGVSWYELSDGAYYSGEMLDGKPNGFGILQEANHYWIGTYRDGLKHGRFLVVKCDNPEDSRYLDFENGDEVGNQAHAVAPSHESCTVRAKSVTLREEAGYDSGSTAVKIQQGELVYLTDQDSVTKDDVVWVQVQTKDGFIGWCESGALLMEED